MRLLRLRIENIATYERQEVRFSELSYPVFVTGRTGAGKTTLFVDAITASLYGTAYGTAERGISRELVMKGKREGRLELEFEVEGGRYLVKRRLRGGGGQEASLWTWDCKRSSWRPLSTSVLEVNRLVEELVGLDFRGLMNSVVVRQGDVYSFIEMRPSERREVLLEILNIKFDKLKDLASERAKRLSLEASRLEALVKQLEEEVRREGELRREAERISRELPALLNELERRTVERDRLRRRVEELSARLGELKSELERLRGLEEELRVQEREARELEAELAKLEERIAELGPEKLERLSELEALSISLERARARSELLEARLRELERELGLARSARDARAALEVLESAERELEEARRELMDRISRAGEVRSRVESLKEAIGELERAAGTCPLCGSPMDEERKRRRLEQLSRELEKFEREAAELEREIGRLERKVEELEGVEKKKVALEAVLKSIPERSRELDPSELEIEVANVKRELEEARREASKIEAELLEATGTNSLREARRALDAIREVRDMAPRLEALRRELERRKRDVYKLGRELEKKPSIEREAEEKYGEKEELSRRLARVEEDLERLNREVASRGQRLRDLEEELKRIEDCKERLREYSRRLEELRLDERAYALLASRVFSPGALPAALLKEYVRLVEEYANDYLRSFGQDISLSLEFAERKGQQSVELKVYSGGYQRDVRTFSGGEATLIGFALRLAVGRLAAELCAGTKRPRFLVVDEGFGPLDSELRSRVADALESLYASREYEQIVVISHQQDLMAHPVFRTVLEVERDEKGISRIREISA